MTAYLTSSSRVLGFKLKVSSLQVSLICLALILMVFAIFAQTLRDGFFMIDDSQNISAVPSVSAGCSLQGLKWAFTHAQIHRWTPLATLSRQIDCQFYGLNPWGHHLTNVCLHALAAVLLFLALRSLTGVIWGSALVAAIFATHPLHVESVAWLSCRSELLGGIFFFLTIWFYARYARTPTPIGYLMVLLWFLFGLLSKPMIVTLPMILILLDYWPLRRLRQWKDLIKLVLEKIPFMIVALIFSEVALLLQATTLRQWVPHSLGNRLCNALVALWMYLYTTCWPRGLYLGYDVPEGGWPIGMIVISALSLVFLSAVVILLRLSKPYLLTGWLWFFVMLLPVLGIIPICVESRADRYMYLPLIGLVIALVWLGEEWSRRYLSPSVRSVVITLLSISFLGWFGFASWIQASKWKDDLTFWRHALDSGKDKARLKLEMGLSIYEMGDHSGGLALMEEAVRLNPDRVDLRNSLGCTLLDFGRYDEAVNQFTEALKILPGDPRSESNLGWALRQAGKYEEALIHMKKALGGEGFMDACIHYNIGETLFQLGRYDESITHFQWDLKYDSNDILAEEGIAKAFLIKGQLQESIVHFQRVLTLKPNNAEVLQILAELGSFRYNHGERSVGIALLNQVNQLNLDNPIFMNDLAWMLATAPESILRDGMRALYLADRANKKRGGKDPLMLDTLAAAYAETGDFAKALECAHHALILAETSGKMDLVEGLKKEIILYEAGKPLREP